MLDEKYRSSQCCKKEMRAGVLTSLPALHDELQGAAFNDAVEDIEIARIGALYGGIYEALGVPGAQTHSHLAGTAIVRDWHARWSNHQTTHDMATMAESI